MPTTLSVVIVALSATPQNYMRIVWGLIGIAAGTIIIWKTYPLVEFFGKSSWAEEYLRGGLGGTYLLYKIIGLATVLLATMYMFGLWIFG